MSAVISATCSHVFNATPRKSSCFGLQFCCCYAPQVVSATAAGDGMKAGEFTTVLANHFDVCKPPTNRFPAYIRLKDFITRDYFKVPMANSPHSPTEQSAVVHEPAVVHAAPFCLRVWAPLITTAFGHTFVNA